MKYNSFQPFVPSGGDFEASRALFLELGFKIVSESDDYVRFDHHGAGFILQRFDNREFAENFMMRAGVPDLDEFWREASARELPAKFGVKLSEPTNFPWGREVNLIDVAGVCWHFVEGD